jgi:hypothetical protein
VHPSWSSILRWNRQWRWETWFRAWGTCGSTFRKVLRSCMRSTNWFYITVHGMKNVMLFWHYYCIHTPFEASSLGTELRAEKPWRHCLTTRGWRFSIPS